HAAAFGESPVLSTSLEVGGEYLYRIRGEQHVWTPESVAKLQHAVRGKSHETYRDFAKLVNNQSEHFMTPRGLFRIRSAEEIGKTPIAVDDVEPAKEIVKRFATGAMSFGSLGRGATTRV